MGSPGSSAPAAEVDRALSHLLTSGGAGRRDCRAVFCLPSDEPQVTEAFFDKLD